MVLASQQSQVFYEDFEGDPDAPLAWDSEDWDLAVHSRGIEYFYHLESMAADHGPNCEPPPATHELDTYEQAVYQCKNHLMTAINDPGYGVIYLTPNAMVDFSDGEAVIRFDISTLRASQRDWIDLWITFFDDHLQLPLENYLPDLNGEPKNSIHIRMDFTHGAFKGFIIRDFDLQEIPGTSTAWQGYESFITPDNKRRDTFELRISRDHIRFGMPAYNFDWIDTDIPPLDWDQGIVQFGHHSYNPTKCENCQPGTWHWDNIVIDPAIRFTMIPGDRRYVDVSIHPVVKFNPPIPENAFLRFSAIGKNIEVSFDGGLNWQEARVQSQLKYEEDRFWSYWMPVPDGLEQVQFRGQDWWGGTWHVRDISLWSRSAR